MSVSKESKKIELRRDVVGNRFELMCANTLKAFYMFNSIVNVSKNTSRKRLKQHQFTMFAWEIGGTKLGKSDPTPIVSHKGERILKLFHVWFKFRHVTLG